MKILIKQDLSATLPSDRQLVTTIDGSGTLILSRNIHALRLDLGSTGLTVTRLRLHCFNQNSRVRRFFYMVKVVWAFSK